MIPVAFDKDSGTIVRSNTINYTKSKERNTSYYCVICNNKLSFVNDYTKSSGTKVSAHFRHKNNDNECVNIKNDNEKDRLQMNNLFDFVNRWLQCINQKNIYKKNNDNGIVDVINKCGDFIYIKYSLILKTNILNKSNQDGRIIWLLSIYTDADKTNHPRPCTIYSLHNDKHKLIYFCKTTDLVDFVLSDCEVYLDDGHNIYKLLDNDSENEKVFYTSGNNKITGYLVKVIKSDKFINNILENISISVPYFNHNKTKTLYTKDYMRTLNLIETIRTEYKKLGGIECDYNIEDINNKTNDELEKILERIRNDIDKNIIIKKEKNMAHKSNSTILQEQKERATIIATITQKFIKYNIKNTCDFDSFNIYYLRIMNAHLDIHCHNFILKDFLNILEGVRNGTRNSYY